MALATYGTPNRRGREKTSTSRFGQHLQARNLGRYRSGYCHTRCDAMLETTEPRAREAFFSEFQRPCSSVINLSNTFKTWTSVGRRPTALSRVSFSTEPSTMNVFARSTSDTHHALARSIVSLRSP
jgi:hypothetical protein